MRWVRERERSSGDLKVEGGSWGPGRALKQQEVADLQRSCRRRQKWIPVGLSGDSPWQAGDWLQSVHTRCFLAVAVRQLSSFCLRRMLIRPQPVSV